MEQRIFGQTPKGEDVTLYKITNDNGMAMELLDYGAIMRSLWVPDRDGNLGDILLSSPDMDGYTNESPYFGAIVGRYGNRIAKGKFTLDGVEYTLAINNEPNHLHGGNVGFDKVIWKAEEVRERDAAGIRFSYLSKDGEEGYPGNLQISATYLLTNKNEFIVQYAAVTDKATPISLTQHNYYNLAGNGSGDILGHELTIHANGYLPVDAGMIPLGNVASLDNDPMDFRKPMTIGSRIGQVEGGYDHNYTLTKNDSDIRWAASAYEPTSGRVMDIYTTEPGIQFYTGNFLDETIRGKGGITYRKHAGFCLETQKFPDSPNQAQFPSSILRPGEAYSHITKHKFSTR